MRRRWSIALCLGVLGLCASEARAQKLDLDDYLKPSSAPSKPAEEESAPPVASKPSTKADKPALSQQPATLTGKLTPTPPAPKPANTAPAAEGSEAIPEAPKKHAKTAKVAEPKPERPKRQKKKTKYDLMADEWHAPAPLELSAKHAQTAVPDLEFIVQKTGVHYVLKPSSRDGGFDESQLQIAKEAFNSWGPTPHPRTLDLVYAATLHFNSPYVTLISGVRKDRGGSRHSHGLAADIVLPGVEDETLAAFFRAQGFCGVGTYPRAHFVHIDTRDQSFFWVDNSKPNQRTRVQQVRKDESTAADEAARARGALGFVNPPRLQKALKVRAVRKRKAAAAKAERAAARVAAENPQPVSSSSTPER